MRPIRSLAIMCALAAVAALATPTDAHAYDVTVNWVNPTHATNGSTLTGPQALTRTQLFFSVNADVPDNVDTPTVSISPTATTTTHAVVAGPGDVVKVRLKSCFGPPTALVCSSLTNQAQAPPIPLGIPNMPTSVTISLVPPS